MKYNINDYVEKAIEEVSVKTLVDIQVDTALKWCGRACAAKYLGKDEDSHEYANEAIEHAALSGNDKLLNDIRKKMLSYGVTL